MPRVASLRTFVRVHEPGSMRTDRALAGAGIATKPAFEAARHLRAGRLVPVAEATPPRPVRAARLRAHGRHQDPEVRPFVDLGGGAPQEPR